MTTNPVETPEMIAAAQALVNEYVAVETGNANLAVRTANLVAMSDRVARMYNAAGFEIRACELGPERAFLGEAMGLLGEHGSLVCKSHCTSIDRARKAGIPLPVPNETEGGGR